MNAGTSTVANEHRFARLQALYRDRMTTFAPPMTNSSPDFACNERARVTVEEGCCHRNASRMRENSPTLPMGHLADRVLFAASLGELPKVLLVCIELRRRRDGNVDVKVTTTIRPQVTDTLPLRGAGIARLSSRPDNDLFRSSSSVSNVMLVPRAAAVMGTVTVQWRSSP